MYSEVTPWNVFKGCRFDCVYCKPSFQAQAKRQKHNCEKCYSFEPHEHRERFDKIPKGEIIWPGSSGDVSFCDINFLTQITASIFLHPSRTFYLQSKNPAVFDKILGHIRFCNNLILLTTIETNRDEGYNKISKAPTPSARARDFSTLDWPRKIVTIEPIMDFDIDEFVKIILSINPESVWLGYNSRPKAVKLPEPSRAKTECLISNLEFAGIPVKTKFLPWEV